MKYELMLNGEKVEVMNLKRGNDKVSFDFEGELFSFDVKNMKKNQLTLEHEESLIQIPYSKNNFVIEGLDARVDSTKDSQKKKGRSNEGDMISPMPGKILKVLLKAGDSVEKNDVILIMEAMKMEHSIRANVDGVIENIFFKEGDLIDGGVELVELKAQER